MKITKRQLKKIIREEYSRLKRRGLIKESFAEGLELYDGSWTHVPNEAAAIEWAKDQLENDFYGRPHSIRIEGEIGRYGYLCRYSSEVASAGPTIFFCNSKEDCELEWHESVQSI